MPISSPKRVIIDPREKKNAPLLYSLSLKEIKAYDVYPLTDPKTGKEIKCCFTHDLYRYHKHKHPHAYYSVCNPIPLGKGRYGKVLAEEGKWKRENGNAVYKTKTDLYKQKAVKICQLTNIPKKDNELLQDLKHEYEIGSFVPHMGFKYPPVQTDSSILLFMRKHPGESLDRIINQAFKDPRSLTVTERLNITIALLTELEPQINGVQLPKSSVRIEKETITPQRDDPYLVHQDIKPANILRKRINNKEQIKYIDYGFAIPNTEEANYSDPDNENKIQLKGTPLWMDPRRYNTPNWCQPSKTSDLASVARVIADLWGDESRWFLTSVPELKKCNASNTSTHLCDKIPELSDEEKETLKELIGRMTSYYDFDRPSRIEALEAFKAILNQREAILKAKARGRLKDLSVDLLVEILKSPVATLLIKHYKNEPQFFPDLLKKIQPQLYRLDDSTLMALSAIGLDFSKLEITCADLQANHYTPKQIKLLTSLGARLAPNLLNNWFHLVIPANEELAWATMCRALFQATRKPNKKIGPVPQENTFKSVFYWRYLRKGIKATDDDTNVRLVRKHVENVSVLNTQINRMINSCKDYYTEPLAQAIFASSLLTPSNDLLLSYDSNLDSLESNLQQFYLLTRRVSKLQPVPGMVQRNEILSAIKTEVHNRKQLAGFNWETAVSDTKELNNKITVFETMDGLLRRTKSYELAGAENQIRSQLDGLYSAPMEQLQRISSNATTLEKAFTFLKQLNATRAAINVIDCTILPGAKIETELHAAITAVKLDNTTSFAVQLEELNNIYLRLHKQMQGLQYQLFTLDSPYEQERKKIYSAFKIELTTSLTKHNKPQTMQLLKDYELFAATDRMFVKYLESNPTVMRFVYSVLLDNITSLKSNGMLTALLLMQSSNLHQLLTPELIRTIDSTLQSLTGVSNNDAHKQMLKKFQSSLWAYLSDNVSDPAIHKQKMQKDWDALYTTLTIQKPTRSAYEFFPVEQPANTEHRTPHVTSEQPSRES